MQWLSIFFLSCPAVERAAKKLKGGRIFCRFVFFVGPIVGCVSALGSIPVRSHLVFFFCCVEFFFFLASCVADSFFKIGSYLVRNIQQKW